MRLNCDSVIYWGIRHHHRQSPPQDCHEERKKINHREKRNNDDGASLKPPPSHSSTSRMNSRIRNPPPLTHGKGIIDHRLAEWIVFEFGHIAGCDVPL